jgi:hypothetical protein
MNPFETKSVCTCPTADANTLLEIQNYSAEAGFAKFDPLMVRMIATMTSQNPDHNHHKWIRSVPVTMD